MRLHLKIMLHPHDLQEDHHYFQLNPFILLKTYSFLSKYHEFDFFMTRTRDNLLYWFGSLKMYLHVCQMFFHLFELMCRYIFFILQI